VAESSAHYQTEKFRNNVTDTDTAIVGGLITVTSAFVERRHCCVRDCGRQELHRSRDRVEDGASDAATSFAVLGVAVFVRFRAHPPKRFSIGTSTTQASSSTAKAISAFPLALRAMPAPLYFYSLASGLVHQHRTIATYHDALNFSTRTTHQGWCTGTVT